MKKYFFFLTICFLFSSFLNAQIGHSNADQFSALPANFWILTPDGCKLTIYYNEGEEKTKFAIDCAGDIVTVEINWVALLGYANPQPAEGSTFVLENKNLNYITKPEVNLKIHLNYLGNKNLKVEIKTEDFSWNEILKINFEQEFVCPRDSNCIDYVISNPKISELVNYFERNTEYAPYLQELVNKINENKDSAYEMARASAIFFKNWFVTIVNLDSFYQSGLIFTKMVGGHCKTDECCMVKCYKSGRCENYCWPKCNRLYADP